MDILKYYQQIINDFKHLFRQTPELDIETKDDMEIHKITFYLIDSFYGETKLRVREWYDKEKNLVQYRYCWEKNRTKPGHISAWENEPHAVPHPTEIETVPHHHHHVPADRTKIQNNWSVRNIEIVFKTIEPYLINGKEYDSIEI